MRSDETGIVKKIYSVLAAFIYMGEGMCLRMRHLLNVLRNYYVLICRKRLATTMKPEAENDSNL